MSRRYADQRSNRVRLKADAAVLLHRIKGFVQGEIVDGTSEAQLLAEIAEMRVRLHPPSGARAPVVLTDYTTKKQKRPTQADKIDWKAEGLFNPNGLVGARYRKG